MWKNINTASKRRLTSDNKQADEKKLDNRKLIIIFIIDIDILDIDIIDIDIIDMHIIDIDNDMKMIILKRHTSKMGNMNIEKYGVKNVDNDDG